MKCSSCERDLNRITTLESNLATPKTRIANKVCAGTGNTNVQGASDSTTSSKVGPNCYSLQSVLECLPNDSILTEQKKDPLNLQTLLLPLRFVLC